MPKRRKASLFFVIALWYFVYFVFYLFLRNVKRRRRRRATHLLNPTQGSECKKREIIFLCSILFLKEKVYFDSTGVLSLRDRNPETDEERKYLFDLGKEILRAHPIKCSEGHLLKYVNMRTTATLFVGYWWGYTCDVCGRNYKIGLHSIYCLHCRRCFYDLCPDCTKKKLTRMANFIAYPYEILGVLPK